MTLVISYIELNVSLSFSISIGKELDGQLICKKKRGDPRSIVVTISLQGQLYKYIMD